MGLALRRSEGVRKVSIIESLVKWNGDQREDLEFDWFDLRFGNMVVGPVGVK